MKKETKHRWEKEPFILRKCPLKYKKTLETVIEFIAGISILWMIGGLLYYLLKLPTTLINEQPDIPIYRCFTWCLLVLGPKLFVILYLLLVFIILFIIVYCIGASDYLIHKKSTNKRIKD